MLVDFFELLKFQIQISLWLFTNFINQEKLAPISYPEAIQNTISFTISQFKIYGAFIKIYFLLVRTSKY
mgnify:CR=1 FL=1